MDDVEQGPALQHEDVDDLRDGVDAARVLVLLAHALRRHQRPLAVLDEVLAVDRLRDQRQVDVAALLRPRAERQVTLLPVERVGGDVDDTGALQNAGAHPRHAARVLHDEVRVGQRRDS